MLESRHLVGLFLLLVVIFGVVFTLGYLLGRSQNDSAVRAASGKSPDIASPVVPDSDKLKNGPEDAGGLPPQNSSDWDFYHSAEPKSADDHLQPPPKAIAPVKPAAAPKPLSTPPIVPARSAVPPGIVKKKSPPLLAPLIAKGDVMLQVAAVLRQEDALDLAQALQKKKFPAFVITPGADKYYRVQVGPYADAKSATIARQNLEAQGFKSILKR